MRYLIDTNIVVFSVIEHDRISKEVRNILTNYENQIYVSSESIKEIFMLLQYQKITVPAWKYPHDIFYTIEKEYQFVIKYVKKEHLLTFANLAPVKDHNDPFDRMIIAQAITENMPLISSDATFKYYSRRKLDFIFNDK
jgi:PIN domain nuclease of toxin-antitoxin system